jgi:hypothetical protein
MSDPQAETTEARAAREDHGLVRFVSVLALVAAILTSVFTAIGLIAILAGQPTLVDIPVIAHAPTLPAGIQDITGPTAEIAGGPDHLALTVAGLSIETRLLLAAGLLLGGATFAIIALLVRRLACSVLDDDAYGGVASRAIGASAVVLALGWFAASILNQLGAWHAGVEALQIDDWTASGPARDILIASTNATDLSLFGWPEPSFAVTFEFTPLLVALALGCIAAIFRAGERLRVRAERAEADAEGLV